MTTANKSSRRKNLNVFNRLRRDFHCLPSQILEVVQKANPEMQDPARFPGSQPVSLARSNLQLLQAHRDRYHVSWKVRKGASLV